MAARRQSAWRRLLRRRPPPAARRATHSLYQWPHTTPATTCHFICNHGSSVNLGTDEEAAVGDALATLLLSAPLWECEAANCHVGGNRPKRQHAGSGQRRHFCPACREPRINCMLALVALLYAKRLERACRERSRMVTVSSHSCGGEGAAPRRGAACDDYENPPPPC